MSELGPQADIVTATAKLRGNNVGGAARRAEPTRIPSKFDPFRVRSQRASRLIPVRAWSDAAQCQRNHALEGAE
jgi:hypothetical protein